LAIIFRRQPLYEKNEPSLNTDLVAVKIEEGRLLELRHSNCVGPRVNPKMEVTERVELEGKGSRCIVTKNVAIKKHGIPWLFIPLIWLVTLFGKPIKEDRLKVMCERKA
jgi:hypothetical protein